LPDLLLDLIGIRKTVDLQLGEDLFPIEEDFEGSGLSWDDGHAALELLVIIMEEVLRQTGGSSKVSSGGAVFDSDGGLRLSPVGRSGVIHASVSLLSYDERWRVSSFVLIAIRVSHGWCQVTTALPDH